MKKQSIKTTERGRFRGMDMKDLQASAQADCWDNALTVVAYSLPLSTNGLFAYKLRVRRLLEGIPPAQLGQIGPYRTAASPNSHIACFKHAVDFLIPDKTLIYAMRKGKVIEVKEDSTSWGDGPEYRDSLNFITVAHPNREFSQYCHLLKGSVSQAKVKVGDTVEVGQRIGRVGKSGWTDRDHLHVIVFTEDPSSPFGFKSLRIRWWYS